MKAANLKLGTKVIVTAFGLDKQNTITSITSSEEMPGYLIIVLKESSSIIRVPYSKQLDYWGETPILI